MEESFHFQVERGKQLETLDVRGCRARESKEQERDRAETTRRAARAFDEEHDPKTQRGVITTAQADACRVAGALTVEACGAENAVG